MNKEALREWSHHSENEWEGFLAEEYLFRVTERRTWQLPSLNFLEAYGHKFVPNMMGNHD